MSITRKLGLFLCPSPVHWVCSCVHHPYTGSVLVSITRTLGLLLCPSPVHWVCSCGRHPYTGSVFVDVTSTWGLFLWTSPVPSVCSCVHHPCPRSVLVSVLVSMSFCPIANSSHWVLFSWNNEKANLVKFGMWTKTWFVDSGPWGWCFLDGNCGFHRNREVWMHFKERNQG